MTTKPLCPLRNLPGREPIYIDHAHWALTAKQAKILCGGTLPKDGYERVIDTQTLPDNLELNTSRIDYMAVSRTRVSCRTDIPGGTHWCVFAPIDVNRELTENKENTTMKTTFAFISSKHSTPYFFDTRDEAVEHLLSCKYADELYIADRQGEIDAFGNDEEEFVTVHGKNAWNNYNNQFNWLVTGNDIVSACGWYETEEQAKAALEEAAIQAIYYATTERVYIEERDVYLVVNFATLDQLLTGSTESEQEAFCAAARAYADKEETKFMVVRNIQQPGFYLSCDEGETPCTEFDWDLESAFTAICDMMAMA